MQQINTITEKQTRAFNKAAVHPLQSWEWGEFRREWGNEVVSMSYTDENSVASTALLTLHRLPLTKYKIGAMLKGPKPSKTLLHELFVTGKEENCLFIKLEPNLAFGLQTTDFSSKQNDKKKLIKLLREYGCVSGKTLFTPTSFWIDLTKSEDELMKGFSSKTRYNIRLAQRKGVKVIEDNSDKAFEKYIKLMRETVERQGFYAHTEKYHRLMWKHLNQLPIRNSQLPIARLLVAKYKGEIITCWIVFVWHGFLYYPYGASSDKYKNVMANNSMMWEAIRYGRNLKLKTFDLWGREEGKGFTKFKEGYNPQVVEFLGTWDLITNPLYWLYRLAEDIRWKFLRLKSKFIKPEF